VTIRLLLLAAAFPWMAAQSQAPQVPPDVLPAKAVSTLAASLTASAKHPRQVWRDIPPVNSDGTVNGYIEIAKGDRRKWEFDLAANARRIDRLMPADIGGYPVNYGFVPQTVSYDGDPFDILVLGPPIDGGTVVRGRAVGVMFMEDEKGLDSKVVVSRLGPDGRPLHALTAAIQREIGDYFNRYKQNEPGAFSKVPGWGTADVGLEYVRMTNRFFLDCRKDATAPCRIPRR
jgi:inorganic pyrophosphatase